MFSGSSLDVEQTKLPSFVCWWIDEITFQTLEVVSLKKCKVELSMRLFDIDVRARCALVEQGDWDLSLKKFRRVLEIQGLKQLLLKIGEMRNIFNGNGIYSMDCILSLICLMDCSEHIRLIWKPDSSKRKRWTKKIRINLSRVVNIWAKGSLKQSTNFRVNRLCSKYLLNRGLQWGSNDNFLLSH